MIMQLF